MLTILLVSCSDSPSQTPSTSDDTSSRSLSGLACFQGLGSVHNEILHASLQSFDENTQVLALDEGVDYLVQVQTEEISKQNYSSQTKSRLTTGIEEHKNYMIPGVLKQRFDYTNATFVPTTENIKAASVYQLLAYASEKKLITETEHDILSSLARLISSNAEGTISNDAYITELNTIRNDWESVYGKTTYFNPNSDIIPVSTKLKDGAMSGAVLNIALNSAEYWSTLNDQGEGTDECPWLASDAAGALVGAVSGGIMSYIQDDEINWSSVGWSALGGALDSSLGLTGRVTKWIRHLF